MFMKTENKTPYLTVNCLSLLVAVKGGVFAVRRSVRVGRLQDHLTKAKTQKKENLWT